MAQAPRNVNMKLGKITILVVSLSSYKNSISYCSALECLRGKNCRRAKNHSPSFTVGE